MRSTIARLSSSGQLPAQCAHIDYDDYFERCLDCGLGGEEIHARECGGFPDGYEALDAATVRCNRCGVTTLVARALLAYPDE